MTELANRLMLAPDRTSNKVVRMNAAGLEAGLIEVVRLLATCLRGGAGYREALEYVEARSSGAVKPHLTEMLEAVRLGDSLSMSLLRYESCAAHPALRELALKIALAEQLGSPVATQLDRLADSLLANQIVELGAIGLKKENRMMFPVVFLVLPVTVLFAVFPSMQFLPMAPI